MASENDDHDVCVVGKCSLCGEQIEDFIPAFELEMMDAPFTIAGLCPECEKEEAENREWAKTEAGKAAEKALAKTLDISVAELRERCRC